MFESAIKSSPINCGSRLSFRVVFLLLSLHCFFVRTELTCLKTDKWSLVFTQKLKSEQKQKGHHKTEKTHSFRQSETQNGVWKELLFQWWITGVSDNEGTEDRSNTSTRSCDSNGGSSCTNELSGRVNVILLGSGGKSTASNDSLKKKKKILSYTLKWLNSKNSLQIEHSKFLQPYILHLVYDSIVGTWCNWSIRTIRIYRYGIMFALVNSMNFYNCRVLVMDWT